MAEQDRDIVRRERASLLREKAVMKDVPDWEVRTSWGVFMWLTRVAMMPWLGPLHQPAFAITGGPECIQHQALRAEQLCSHVSSSYENVRECGSGACPAAAARGARHAATHAVVLGAASHEAVAGSAHQVEAAV